MAEDIIYRDLSYRIVGLFYKVHLELGQYRNEKQYGDYFEQLLKDNKINYKREYAFQNAVTFENISRSICDFIIEDKAIIEFKAKNFITKEDYYQAKRYLVTLDKKLAFLVNFRQTRLAPKRVLNSECNKY